MVDFKGEQQNLVGGLEHEFYFQSYMGISSSQLTNSIIFQRGSSHQPDVHGIGWWENLQESPIFDGKNHGFLQIFP